MSNLSNSQKWVIVAFTATALTAAVTLFLSDDVRTFGYILIGLLVAGFAVLNNNDQEGKRKNSE